MQAKMRSPIQRQRERLVELVGANVHQFGNGRKSTPSLERVTSEGIGYEFQFKVSCDTSCSFSILVYDLKLGLVTIDAYLME